MNSDIGSLSKKPSTQESNEPSQITPNNVTKIRAPLHPNGCPKDTAPPCTLTLSCSILTGTKTVEIRTCWYWFEMDQNHKTKSTEKIVQLDFQISRRQFIKIRIELS